MASNWAEQRLMETAALRSALAHADQLSPLDRVLVEAYAGYAGGAHVEAKRRYREITRAWPEEQEAWYVLGEVLFHYGYLSGEPISRADTVLSRAAELDPGNQYFEVLFHLLHIAMADPGTDRLDSLIARIGPEREWSIAARLYSRGDAAAVDSLAGLIERARMPSFFFAELAPGLEARERMAEAFAAAGRSDADRALGHLELAGIRVARGDWDGALAEIRPAAALRPGLALELKAYMALAAPAGLTGIDMGAGSYRSWKPGTRPPTRHCRGRGRTTRPMRASVPGCAAGNACKARAPESAPDGRRRGERVEARHPVLN